MIDPSKLTPEDFAVIKAYNEEEFLRHLQAAYGATFYHLEHLADTLEAEAKRIRELLKDRAAYPRRTG